MTATPTLPPVALTIAGSDNSAGAGIQADLKTFAANGVYGLTALTCVVAEVPGHVSSVQPLPVSIIAEQIRLCLQAFPVAAIKTGMLFSKEIIEEVAAILSALHERPHLVIDPVMVASSGHPLLEPDAIQAYKELLFPLADLITPNLDEARVLSGDPIADLAALEKTGHALCTKYGTAFLMKGGHFQADSATDVLITKDALEHFTSPYLRGIDTHGTGCTLSAAITAGLARGQSLRESVGGAKQFIDLALSRHHRWEKTNTDALNHFSRKSWI